MASEEPDTKYCSNCKRDIAAVNFVMHEVHCRRNIVLCKHCQEPVPKGDQDEHYEEYHAKVKCEKCNQTLEKSKVDDHQGDCPKRTAHCSYCELDMPFCDLKDHMEYCGSRTEQCEICQQYIMLKDMIKHTDMGCKYPNNDTNNGAQTRMNNTGAATSPSRPYNAANAVPSQRNNGAMNDVYSNFAVDEITRLIGGTGIGAAGPSSRAFNSRAQPARNHASSTSTKSRGKLPITKNFNRANKRTNEISGGRSQNYGANLNPSSGDSFEADRMLAMHLAQDLGHDPADFQMQHGFPSNTEDFDDVSIPCEFCGEPFTIENLILHQTSCNQDSHNSTSPERNSQTLVSEEATNTRSTGVNSDLSRSSGVPNDTRSRSEVANNARDAPRSSNPPPVLNNLQYAAAQEMFSSPHLESSLSPSDILLPCEFCDNLFPEDIIIQHQSVCDENLTSTPRTRTPVNTRSTTRTRPTQQPLFTTKRTNTQGISGYTPTRKTTNTSTRETRPHQSRQNLRGSQFNALVNSRNGQSSSPLEHKKTAPSSRPKSFAAARRRNTGHSSGPVGQGDAGMESGDADVDMDHLISDPNATTNDLLNHMDKQDKTKNKRAQSNGSAASNGVHDTKPRVPSSRRQNDIAGPSSYQASFASPAVTGYSSKKPKPVKTSTFQSDLNPGSLRVAPTRPNPSGVGQPTGARLTVGSTNQPRYVSTKQNNTTASTVKTKRHPQGDV